MRKTEGKKREKRKTSGIVPVAPKTKSGTLPVATIVKAARTTQNSTKPLPTSDPTTNGNARCRVVRLGRRRGGALGHPLRQARRVGVGGSRLGGSRLGVAGGLVEGEGARGSCELAVDLLALGLAHPLLASRLPVHVQRRLVVGVDVKVAPHGGGHAVPLVPCRGAELVQAVSVVDELQELVVLVAGCAQTQAKAAKIGWEKLCHVMPMHVARWARRAKSSKRTTQIPRCPKTSNESYMRQYGNVVVFTH